MHSKRHTDTHRHTHRHRHTNTHLKTHSVSLAVSELHVDVRVPSLGLWVPIHPPLKHGTRPCNVLELLLHVRELVPERVHTRQQRDCAVVDVARVVDLPVLHLHLSILDPQRRGARVRVQPALIHGACAEQQEGEGKEAGKEEEEEEEAC